MSEDRIRLRRNPPNVSTPQGYEDLYVDSSGTFIRETAGGVKAAVGASEALAAATSAANIQAALAADPAAARDAAQVPIVAQGPLALPNYSQWNSTIHASAIYCESPLFGYRYWLGHTPWPQDPAPGNAANPLEYPAVAASNDGVNWEVPVGMTLPIYLGTTDSPVDPFDTYQHAADITILKTEAGTLRAYWIMSRDAVPYRHALLGAECSDGVNWVLLGANSGWLLEVDDWSITSPTVLQLDDDTYAMWSTFVPSGAGTYDVYYRTSADGVTWSAATACTMPANSRIWHADVRPDPVNGGYIMLGQQRYSPERPSANFCVLRSTDGLTWTGNPNSLIFPEYTDLPKAFAGGGYYRSGIIPRKDGLADIFLGTLMSEDSGEGDTSGDVVSDPGLYRRSTISLVRGCRLDAVNHLTWATPDDNRERVKRFGVPILEFEGERTEYFNPYGGTKGWQFRYATPYAGLPAGDSVRLTLGKKTGLADGSALGLGRAHGRMEISGTLNNGSTYKADSAIILTGTESGGNQTLAATTANLMGATGNRQFFARTNVIVAGESYSATPAEGDTITFHNAGTDALEVTATIHKNVSAATFLNLYIREPDGTLPIVVGQKIKINGEWLTYGAAVTQITVGSLPYPLASGGLNVLYHTLPSGNDDGGYMELWNNTAYAFHGEVFYRSFR